MVMIRRGRWKFILTPSDPDQLFDLDTDPLELANLAAEPRHDVAVREFREEVRARWDLEAIEQAVRESQRARLAVFRALRQGVPYPWDFQPSRAAAKPYSPKTIDVAERDQQSRYPPVPPR
jgi:choline-sulfatase